MMEKLLIQCIVCFDRELSFGFMFLKLYFSPLPQKKNNNNYKTKKQTFILHLSYPIVDLFIGSQINS